MTDTAWIALATMIPATISSLAALIIAIRTGKKVDMVEKQTNSMKDALVKVTGESEHAKGVLQGRREAQ